MKLSLNCLQSAPALTDHLRLRHCCDVAALLFSRQADPNDSLSRFDAQYYSLMYLIGMWVFCGTSLWLTIRLLAANHHPAPTPLRRARLLRPPCYALTDPKCIPLGLDLVLPFCIIASGAYAAMCALRQRTVALYGTGMVPVPGAALAAATAADVLNGMLFPAVPAWRVPHWHVADLVNLGGSDLHSGKLELNSDS
ncbi:hypothetical protein B0H19DRAFT_1262967 [Mycena capillaripes]|nr:hypothetical protein B0H19DRAFT_1262967 [Mycena capillaripes]